MADYSVGIDFGASNIKVAYYNETTNEIKKLKIDREQERIENPRAENAIYYRSADEYVVGKHALKNGITEPENLVDGIKRKLELENWTKDFKTLGFSRSAEEIAIDVFRWVKTRVQDQGHDIQAAVITVPVCFSEVQKQRIVKAAHGAGIPVQATLSEPVAGLFSIPELMDVDADGRLSRNVVVFDFGGSTLDLCLARVVRDGDSTRVQIETACGAHLGGSDLTRMLQHDLIYPQYLRNSDRQSPCDSQYLEDELNRFTDTMKEELFEDEDNDEVFDVFSSHLTRDQNVEIELTRDEALECFDAHGLRDNISAALNRLFEDSDRIEQDDVDVVMMFGGGSRVPEFRDIVEEYFGRDVIEYDEDKAYYAVANGAVRYGQLLQEQDKRVAIENVLPFCIGVNESGRFRKVVRRNEKYGVFSSSRLLRDITNADNGWTISLYQSFSDNPRSIQSDEDVVYMGSVQIDPTQYENTEKILYKFGVDHGGRIVGRFYDVDDQNEIRMREEKEVIVGDTHALPK